MHERNTALFTCVVFLALAAAGARAQTDAAAPAGETPEQKGLRIVRESERRDAGWLDMQSSVTMMLRNKSGQTSERKLRASALEVTDDGDKSLVVFDAPRDVSGTAFLSFSHALEPDEQWLFLPALKRVKRISSANKSGPFMGSEFAYEDMASPEVKKYTYKWLRDEAIDGRDSFVIEEYPQYEKSGYKRLILWLDKERYVPLKTEFYDRKNSLLKTLTYHDYKQYLDKHWRPDETRMINHQTGKSTSLVSAAIRFKTGLEDGDFNQTALQRAR